MTDRMILGNGVIYSTDSAETGLNNNVIVCATSGCGKTMSILEPRLLETFESSLIVTITKRKLVDKYTHVFQERGYEVLDLNFVSPHLSGAAYDPLLFIKNTGDIHSFHELSDTSWKTAMSCHRNAERRKQQLSSYNGKPRHCTAHSRTMTGLFLFLSELEVCKMHRKRLTVTVAFEAMMKETPYAKYDSGYDGILPECRTCRFHRPHWKYQSCVFEKCPYASNGISTRRSDTKES